MPANDANPIDEDGLMRRYLREAGDPSVEPPAEHVARLRSLLMDRLAPPRAPRQWRAPALVGAGLAALSIVAALLALVGPQIAWADVAKALRERPWIHGVVRGPGGAVIVEQWLSSRRDVGAERAGREVRFHDYQGKTVAKFVPADNVIYRLTESPEGSSGEENFLRPLLDQLLDPKGPGQFPFPGMELIGQTRREVTKEGKKWLQIELSLRVAGGSRGETASLQILVDAATSLPASMTLVAEDGNRHVAEIDYPERGPVDIYDLGVPRSAKVVDRGTSEAVERVLAGLKKGRNEFDDYRAFVVDQIVLPANELPRLIVHRVLRKGRKWRIDQLRPQRQDWALPAAIDAQWWKDHENDFTFVPRVICTGAAYFDYYLAEQWKPGMPVPKPGARGGAAGVGQTIGPNQLSGPADDPVLPFWCQDLLLEHAGRPTAGIGQPDHDREFLVEPTAKGGPPGTILFRGRDPKAPAAGSVDHFRLWVDPKAGYLSMRTEIRVGDAANVARVAFIFTTIVESTERSPKGHWRPTRTRQISHNGAREVDRRFYVDFDAPIPDALFEPLD